MPRLTGTATNLEGRISVLNRKVTAPGTARDDWSIAAELARRLGADLGLESVAEIWDEIEAVAPSHAGITAELLRSTDGRDGVVAPLRQVATGGSGQPDHAIDEDSAAHAVAAAAADDESDQQSEEAAATEAQASAEAEPGESAEADAADPVADAAGPARPELIAYEPGEPQSAAPVDAYSLRLVAIRKLYDLGVGVQHSPSLAHLAGSAVLRVNPYDFARIGVSDGADVTVTSPRGSVTLPVHADSAVPRGAAAVPVNLHGPSVTDLIDASLPVTEVHVEVTK